MNNILLDLSVPPITRAGKISPAWNEADCLPPEFCEKVLFSNTGCWTWTGTKSSNGYGTVSYGGATVRAHRLMFAFVYGPIPSQMEIMHSCDNRTCVNPAHLSIGTHHDNVRDMDMKGRRAPMPIGPAFGKDDVLEICRLFKSGASKADIARKYGVCSTTICRVILGRMLRGERKTYKPS